MSKQSWDDTLRDMAYAELREHQRASGADDIIKPLYYAANPHRRPRKKPVFKGGTTSWATNTVTYTAELKIPTLEANLISYGEIRELKHPWFKRTFEAGKDGNQVEMVCFQGMLEAKGYKTERKDDDILITKGSISVMLVLHYPPFSDSTIEQIDYIFDTLDQEVRDSMQAEVDRTLASSEAFWAKTSQRNDLMRKVDSRYRDGDWFESCKSDDHDD